jgi:hypothetical protein
MAQNYDHIEPLRLFDLAWTNSLPTHEETKHLNECEQCEDSLELFTRRFGKPPEEPEDAA